MHLRIFFTALLTSLLTSGLAQTNDNFANRLALTGSRVTVLSNNLHATREAGEPNHAGSTGGRSLWWSWTAPSSGVFNVSAYPGSNGGAVPRALAIYTGNSLTALTEVTSSNNNASAPYFSTGPSTLVTQVGASLNLQATAGTTYQIAVDASYNFLYAADDGTVVLSINAPSTILSAASVNVTTGTAFQYNILASNNPSSYGASSLPVGLSINPYTGQITGTPTTSGSYAVGLSATGAGGTGTATLIIQVNDAVPTAPTAPVFNMAAATTGYLGVSFSEYPSATGATSYTMSGLPPGLSYSTSGDPITGTPTQIGSFPVAVTATNSVGSTTANVSIKVAAAPLPPIMDGPLTASGTTGVAFSYYISADYAANSGTITYGATGLPPGLSLGTSSYITGTPTRAGTYSVPISVTNAGGTRTATVLMTISAPTIPAPVSAPPALTSSATAAGSLGTVFSYALAATNSPTGYGATGLPSGLSVNASTGVISGTPKVSGTFLVPVTATNAYGTNNATLTLVLATSATAQASTAGLTLPLITSPAAVGGPTGQSLSYSLTATYNGSSYLSYPNTGSWTFAASGLPPGMRLSATTSTTGFVNILGTPTTVGTYAATVSATVPATTYSPAHPALTTTATVTFVINQGSGGSVPVFSCSASTATTLGSSFAFYPSTTGSPTSYAASGLPPGLSINASGGNITGTPTTTGTYPATLSATNSVGTGSAIVTFVVVLPSAAFISSSPAASGTIGTAFNYVINGGLYVTNSAADNLPAGLSFNANTGSITGTPTAAGVYRVPISATNAYGTARATLTITVSAPGLPVITSAAVGQGVVGSLFSYSANTLNPATSFAASGLPAGLQIEADYGFISGTPTTAGTYAVTLSATNATGTSTATLTLIVLPLVPPILNGEAIVNTTVGSSAYYYISVANAATSYAASGLPPGCTLTSYGEILGTPTTTGTYNVTLSATNAAGTSTAPLTIFVNSGNSSTPVFSLYTNQVQQLVANNSASFSILASNATSYNASGLPAGLSVNAANGTISGTPTTVGTYPVTISATNASGSVSAAVNLIVKTVDVPVFSGLFASFNSPAGINAGTTTLAAYPAPTSYSANALPAGLSLNSTTGAVTGTPTTPGQYTVDLYATNAGGTGHAVWTVIITDPASVVPVFSTTDAAEAGATVGAYFSDDVSVSDSAGTNYVNLPVTYAFAGLPDGVTASASSSSSNFSGTPTTAGVYPVTITATTSAGVSTSEVVTMVVSNLTIPVFSNSATATGNVGAAFSYYLSSNPNATSYTVSGLPPGVTLNSSTGVITGTPTTTGTYQVAVSGTNVSGTGSATVIFVISPALYGGLPLIRSAATAATQDIVTSANISYGTTSGTFSYNIAAFNGPTSFGATNLPAGLSVNPYSGVISGQPQADGIYNVTIRATNSAGTSSASLTIIATATLPAISSALTAQGASGSTFSYFILNAAWPYPAGTYPYSGTSNPTDPLTYTASGLPPGLSVNTASGYIIGTPSQVGTYPVMVSVSNRAGTSRAVVTISVTAVAAPSPAVTSPTLVGDAMKAGLVGLPLDYWLFGNGATSYSATGLPAGLSLNTTSGEITGTPSTAGTFPVPVTATNSAGAAHAVLTIVVDPALPVVAIGDPVTSTLRIGSSFYEYLYTTYDPEINAVSNATSYTAGNLPAGLTFDPKLGEITGTPTGPAGTYLVPVSLAYGPTVDNEVLVFNVQSPTVPSASTLSSPAGALGFLDHALIYAPGSSFVPSATLPAGLSFDAASGRLGGVPANAGLYRIPLAATDATGNHQAVVTLSVVSPDLALPQVISQPVSTTVFQNDQAVFTVSAAGVPSPTYQWFHAGVPLYGATTASLNLTQVQPGDAGTYTVTISNTSGQVTSVPVTLSVRQTYATWQAAHFTAAEIAQGAAADNIDFTGDGIVNLLKYALGIDPRTGTGGSLPTSTYSYGNAVWHFLFTRDSARQDLNYMVESSPNLSQWTAVASSTAGGTTVNLDGVSVVTEQSQSSPDPTSVAVQVDHPAGSLGRSFMRLRVSRAQNSSPP